MSDQSMTPHEGASLEDLLEKTGTGDRTAFTMLYERSSAKLFGVICRILPERELARDALQESYERIWLSAERFDLARGSAIAWMARIARNRAIDMRRLRSEKLLAEAVPIDEELECAMPDHLAEIEQNQSLARLKECLDELKEPGDEMVLLAYYQGWSRDELARRFERPVATVKTILRRALITLRGCLDE